MWFAKLIFKYPNFISVNLIPIFLILKISEIFNKDNNLIISEPFNKSLPPPALDEVSPVNELWYHGQLNRQQVRPSTSTKDTFLQDFLEILKNSLQNSSKILKK